MNHLDNPESQFFFSFFPFFWGYVYRFGCLTFGWTVERIMPAPRVMINFSPWRLVPLLIMQQLFIKQIAAGCICRGVTSIAICSNKWFVHRTDDFRISWYHDTILLLLFFLRKNALVFPQFSPWMEDSNLWLVRGQIFLEEMKFVPQRKLKGRFGMLCCQHIYF